MSFNTKKELENNKVQPDNGGAGHGDKMGTLLFLQKVM